MYLKITRILFPTIVGATVYFAVDKFGSKKPFDITSQNGSKKNVIKRLFKRAYQNKALKLALISVVATVGVQYFYQQIAAILLNEVFKKQSAEAGPLQIFVEIVEEHNIALHSRSIKQLINTQKHSKEEKVELLKIKLDFIINNELDAHTGFLIISIIILLITTCSAGPMGLAIFLEALYRLLQEGRISQALYNRIVEEATKNFNNSSY